MRPDAPKVGIDIDGTITAYPQNFARLSREILERGGEVHIVSSRSQEAYAETVDELEGYGMRWTALYLLPSITAAQELCPHGELDWFRKHLWLKVAYAQQYRLNSFIDDEARVVELFREYCPGVVAVLASGGYVAISELVFGEA